DHVIAVHSADGMDELSLSDQSFVYEYRRNGSADAIPESRTVQPEDHRLPRAEVEHLRGGDAQENARLISDILDGVQGPHRAVVLLNAAYALHTSGRYPDLDACFDAAIESIDSGSAKRVLTRLVE